MTLLFDALRGGDTAFDDHRRIADEIAEAVPGFRRLLSWSDRFAARAAENAVTAGISTVIFGGAGLPAGDPLHRRAAAASPAARFFYPTPNPVTFALRGRSLEGDPQAAALRASIFDPAAVLGAAAAAGMPAGPVQVQWGLAAWTVSAEDGADLARRWAQVLPAGAQVVITAAEAAGRAGVIAGQPWHGHTAADAARWAAGACLRVTAEIPDVRTAGRAGWGERALARPDSGRIGAAIAAKAS